MSFMPTKVSKSEQPSIPLSEKNTPTRIVVLERRSLLAGSGVVDFYQAQSLCDPFLIGLAIHHNVRFHDVSSEPVPKRIVIRRDQGISVGRGTAQVRSGEVISDPWVVSACINGGASFDPLADDEA